ncbi:MAG TPA: HAD-IIB family hydrolase [Nitrospirota bacterium]|nr:HAD-IIB family hydrolase [Nitrospirota bacterium]
MPTIIIFTDLDGTLLHPRTYSFDEARPALELIRQRDVPFVLCSSKTRAEIEGHRRRLANNHPFISENGGGVFIPEGYFPSFVECEKQDGYRLVRFGSPYRELRNALMDLRERLSIKVRGFGDMSVQEIAYITGLSESEAALSKMRDFDEPFIFEESGAKADVFLQAIEARGYRWTRGRFYHITGENDKGRAVTFLKGLYEKKYNTIRTIGIGDNLNDLPLLRVVDHPVLVRNGNGTYEEEIKLSNLIRADGIGPQGWNRAIMRFLEE